MSAKPLLNDMRDNYFYIVEGGTPPQKAAERRTGRRILGNTHKETPTIKRSLSSSVGYWSRTVETVSEELVEQCRNDTEVDIVDRIREEFVGQFLVDFDWKIVIENLQNWDGCSFSHGKTTKCKPRDPAKEDDEQIKHALHQKIFLRNPFADPDS